MAGAGEHKRDGLIFPSQALSELLHQLRMGAVALTQAQLIMEKIDAENGWPHAGLDADDRPMDADQTEMAQKVAHLGLAAALEAIHKGAGPAAMAASAAVRDPDWTPPGMTPDKVAKLERLAQAVADGEIGAAEAMRQVGNVGSELDKIDTRTSDQRPADGPFDPTDWGIDPS